MPEVHVPVQDRPFVGKYIAGTFFGYSFIGAFVWLASRNIDSMVVGLGVALFAVLAQITIGFIMVEALVKDWFGVAELVDE